MKCAWGWWVAPQKALKYRGKTPTAGNRRGGIGVTRIVSVSGSQTLAGAVILTHCKEPRVLYITVNEVFPKSLGPDEPELDKRHCSKTLNHLNWSPEKRPLV